MFEAKVIVKIIFEKYIVHVFNLKACTNDCKEEVKR